MLSRRRVLPNVPIFILTWTIPDNFGGLTNALLRRATMFSEVDKRRIDIITLDPGLHLETKKTQLRAAGMLGKRVRLRNMWQELRRASDRQLSSISGTAKKPVPGDERLLQVRGTEDVQRCDRSGVVLQVSRFRQDGSLLLTERRDTRRFGQKGGRRLTLFDHGGEVLAQWNTVAKFRQAWLDATIAGRTSILISDAPVTGGQMHTYRRSHVTTFQLHHNPHLSDPAGSLYGPPPARKRNIVLHNDHYDAVVTLTDHQRQEMIAAGLAVDNLVTVSNTFTGTIAQNIGSRSHTCGVVVARLGEQKQLGHAVRAIADARTLGARLDIYGTGPTGEELQALIDRLGVNDCVRLRGYDPHARERFGQASFTIISSLFEGQGLTILESMAAGCIPIAYDIRYGPSSIITHGIDGFLVPAGDLESLTETVEHVIAMDETELMAMRRAAVATVEDYRREPITRKWAEILKTVMAAKQPVLELSGYAGLVFAKLTETTLLLNARVFDEAGDHPDWAMVTWIGRGNDSYGRAPAELTSHEHDTLLTAEVPLERLVASEGMLDFYIDVRIDGNPKRMRLRTHGADLPAVLGGRKSRRPKYATLRAHELT